MRLLVNSRLLEVKLLGESNTLRGFLTAWGWRGASHPRAVQASAVLRVALGAERAGRTEVPWRNTFTVPGQSHLPIQCILTAKSTYSTELSFFSDQTSVSEPLKERVQVTRKRHIWGGLEQHAFGSPTLTPSLHHCSQRGGTGPRGAQGQCSYG